MGDTKIDWADQVWNPTIGCTLIASGCQNCYARDMHNRRHKAYKAGREIDGVEHMAFPEVRA
jgi:protein gp37